MCNKLEVTPLKPLKGINSNILNYKKSTFKKVFFFVQKLRLLSFVFVLLVILAKVNRQESRSC